MATTTYETTKLRVSITTLLQGAESRLYYLFGIVYKNSLSYNWAAFSSTSTCWTDSERDSISGAPVFYSGPILKNEVNSDCTEQNKLRNKKSNQAGVSPGSSQSRGIRSFLLKQGVELA